jgi:diguanylate cyclase (GGDEF)-like protein
MSPYGLARVLRRRPGIAVAGALAAVLGIGWVDRETGDQLSFSLFYLGPVSVAGWVAGVRVGLLISLFAAATSMIGDTWGGGINELVPIWNAGVRLGVLMVTSTTLARLRIGLDAQRELANTDALTGALNPRAFDTIAEHELVTSLRYGRPLTVAYLDLDRFKRVNDTLGHSIGDRLLQIVATELAAHVRPSDVIARMGGDEFAILMPETTLEEATVALDRIREQVHERLRLYGWPVSLSVGLSACCGSGTTVDALIADADRAMYEEKRRADARPQDATDAAQAAPVA